LKAAVRDNTPVALLEHNSLPPHQGEVPPGLTPAHRQSVVAPRREATDEYFPTPQMMHTSLEAADALAKEGIEAK